MLNFYKILYCNSRTYNPQFAQQWLDLLWPDIHKNHLKISLQNHYTQILFNKFRDCYQSIAVPDFQQFINGFEKYLQSPLSSAHEFLKVYQCGTTSVRDCSQHYPGDKQKPLLLWVPSLINRGHIFDITPQHSVINYLAVQHGYESHVIDWGDPGFDESQFTMEDYTSKHLVPLIKQIIATDPSRKIMIIGYCMGGIMVLKALQQCKTITKVALLAVPGQPQIVSSEYKNMINSHDDHQFNYLMPAPCQQFYFHGLNPQGVFEKFYRYGDQHDKTDHNLFIAVEDWLNDGPALANKVAEELLGLDLITGQPTINGNPYLIDSFDYSAHSLLVVTPSSNDLIVTPTSSQALLARLPHATVLSSTLGHIGMIISAKAREHVWEPLAQWFKE